VLEAYSPLQREQIEGVSEGVFEDKSEGVLEAYSPQQHTQIKSVSLKQTQTQLHRHAEF